MKAITLYHISNFLSAFAMTMYSLNIVLVKYHVVSDNFVYLFIGFIALIIWIRSKAKQQDIDVINPINAIMTCRILQIVGFLAFGAGILFIVQHWPFWWLPLAIGSILQFVAFGLTFYLKPIQKETQLLDDVDFE